MSVRVQIVIRPIEEWFLKARELSITSTNELMPMIYRMIKLIGIVKKSRINSEALSAALSELQYELDKSYSRDADRDHELHDMIYGLCQCLLEAYSIDHEPSPDIPSEYSTNTVVGSRSTPTVTPTVSRPYSNPTISYPDKPSTSSASGYDGQYGNTIGTEYGNDSDCKPDISRIDVGPAGIYGHSTKTTEAPPTTRYQTNSFQDMPKVETIDDESIPLNDGMDDDIDDVMEELYNYEEGSDDVVITDEKDIDPNEVAVEHGLDCPICQRSHENVRNTINHIIHAHVTSLKMLGGRIDCGCGSAFHTHHSFVLHTKLAERDKLSTKKCGVDAARVFYVESKVRQAKAVWIKTRMELKARQSGRKTSYKVILDHTRKKKPVPITECPFCREPFKFKLGAYGAGFHRHLFRAHGTSIKRAKLWYECVKCKATAHSESSIKSHLASCYRPDNMILWTYAD